jgi:hypothetical protein
MPFCISVNTARGCDFLRYAFEIIKIRLMIVIRWSGFIGTRFVWMGSFIYKLIRTRLLCCKKTPKLRLPTPRSVLYKSKTTTDCLHTPPSPNWRSVLVTSVIPRRLTLACPRKKWMDNGWMLVVPCMKPIIYFCLLCKVMWLHSKLRHVTQKLNFCTYKNNWMCNITALVDFNPSTLHLGEDQLCTLNQTRLRDLSDYRLVQKDSVLWT